MGCGHCCVLCLGYTVVSGLWSLCVVFGLYSCEWPVVTAVLCLGCTVVSGLWSLLSVWVVQY